MIKKQVFNKNFLNYLISSDGVSLTALEKIIGVSHSTLSLLVRGISVNPQAETVHALATYFKVSTNDFYLDFNYEADNSNTQSKSLHHRLKHLMQRFGIINSSQLHRYTGIAVPTIDRIINGETKSPNKATLSKLAEFFNLTIAQLNGIELIPENKQVIEGGEKLSISVPLIHIDNVNTWITTTDKTFIIKFIDTKLQDISKHSYAITQKSEIKIITYVIDPDIKPEKGDRVVVYDVTGINILEYFDEHSFFTLDYKKLPISYQYKILGVVIQELHQRTAKK